MEGKDEASDNSPSQKLKEMDLNERISGEGAEDIAEGKTIRPTAGTWRPNEEFLKALQEMGVTRNAAEKGLYYTGNMSAEAAAEWVFENIDQPDLHDPFQIDHALSGFEVIKSNLQSRYKMVFVVNDSLKMGIGKIAAQVGHASIGLYREMIETKGQFTDLLEEWKEDGETKVVVKGESAQALMDIESVAMEHRIPTYLVTDAGVTQVTPGSVTVLGLFGERSALNEITGTLKLL